MLCMCRQKPPGQNQNRNQWSFVPENQDAAWSHGGEMMRNVKNLWSSFALCSLQDSSAHADRIWAVNAGGSTSQWHRSRNCSKTTGLRRDVPMAHCLPSTERNKIEGRLLGERWSKKQCKKLAHVGTKLMPSCSRFDTTALWDTKIIL